MRSLVSFRALIVVFGLVALAFPVALAVQAQLIGRLNATLGQIALIRQSQLLAGSIERGQIDEESGVRGFAASGQRTFLEPFERGFASFPNDARELRLRLSDPALRDEPDAIAARALLDAIEARNRLWIQTVAGPVLAGDRSNAVALAGKRLVDAFRADDGALDEHLDHLYAIWIVRRNIVLHTGEIVGASAGAFVVLDLALFVAVLLRMRNALDREHAAVEILQTAIASTVGGHPELEVGSVYFSATRGARVGGDVFDVFRVDATTAMLVVGDVSGKGIGAAVDTAFVRYGLRAYATETRDPAAIVTRFNALYTSERPPEAFIVLFVGFYDAATGTLAYTNAGHDAAFVRRERSLERLAPTNPVVGLDPGEIYTSRTTRVGSRETIVIATDGLTEARDSQRNFLAAGEVERWITGARDTTPQALADDLAAKVRRWTRNRIADDLAILAVRPRAESA